MNNIVISISEYEIIICSADSTKEVIPPIFQFPKYIISEIPAAVGMSSVLDCSQSLTPAQITFDDILNNKQEVTSISFTKKNPNDIYSVVSLFSGAGIFDWAFVNDSRFRIDYAIDCEASACKTYRENIGPHIIQGDIHNAFTATGYELDKSIRSPDVIIGDPSCKPFSNANRQTRLEDHPDSDLILQYMRVVQVLNPKIFAIENVPSILTACNGTYFKEVVRVSNNMGYTVHSQVVQDNEVGGYTTRKRAIIIGSRIGEIQNPVKLKLIESKTVADALGQIDSSWSNYTDVTRPSIETIHRMSFVPQGGNYLDIPNEFRTSSKNRHSSTYRRLEWNKPSPTIVNWRKPPLIHPTENRTLTVAEAKALHGLPKDFQIFGTLSQMQQQVGNSVPLAIGKFVKNLILRLLLQEKAPNNFPVAQVYTIF